MQKLPMVPITYIPTSLIIPNPYQPRKRFERHALEDLVYSIKEKGILMPLIVSKTSAGRYELIAGERRFRAAKALNIRRIPAIIRRVNSQEKLELAIIENVQRQELNALDEARSYYTLKEEFGLSQNQIAKRMGKPRSTVANSLRLLTLPSYIQESLETGMLTKSHAKLLLSLNDRKSEQRTLYNTLTREELSVLQTVGHVTKKTKVKLKRGMHDAEIHSWQNELRDHLATKVLIRHKKNRGTISVEYYSTEELQNIVRRMLGKI